MLRYRAYNIYKALYGKKHEDDTRITRIHSTTVKQTCTVRIAPLEYAATAYANMTPQEREHADRDHSGLEAHDEAAYLDSLAMGRLLTHFDGS